MQGNNEHRIGEDADRVRARVEIWIMQRLILRTSDRAEVRTRNSNHR